MFANTVLPSLKPPLSPIVKGSRLQPQLFGFENNSPANSAQAYQLQYQFTPNLLAN